MKNIHLLTPFPEIVNSFISVSIMSRAAKKNLVQYSIKNLFNYADPPHYRIDDYPFGGGPGMILKPEPVFRAYDESIEELPNNKKLRVVFPTPDGCLFNHDMAKDLASSDSLIFINGHYKGIDQRIRDELVTDEISIGDYILTGGELPSLIILDAIIRLIPDVLNSYDSAQTDSFFYPLLDFPHYTRPEIYRGMRSPSILLSGDHKKIENWKNIQRKTKTKLRRPDLWKQFKN